MILFLALLLCGVQYSTPHGRNNNLDIVESNALRGAFSFFIVIYHIHKITEFATPGTMWLTPIDEAKILSNGLFFFLSGYGLWWSKKNKINYLSFFNLFERIIKLGIPAYATYLLYILFNYNDKEGLLKQLFLGKIIEYIRYNDVTWFMIELVILYVLFWVLYRIWSAEVANIIFGTLILCWDVVAFFWGRGLVWYASSLCFLVGILICQKRDTILAKIQKRYIFYLSILGLVFISTFIIHMILPPFNIWGYLICANIATVFFCCFLYLLTYKVKFGNKIIVWLGGFSYEIYLVHMIIIKVINEYTENELVRVYAVTIVSLVIAYLVKRISNIVYKLFSSILMKIKVENV